jgi:hypothetical protein
VILSITDYAYQRTSILLLRSVMGAVNNGKQLIFCKSGGYLSEIDQGGLPERKPFGTSIQE